MEGAHLSTPPRSDQGASGPAPGATNEDLPGKITEDRKRKFAERFAHDLRGRLASIKGFALLLKDHELPADERDEYIQSIDHAVEGSLHLANHLLDFALLADGSQHPPEDIDLKEVVVYTANQLRGAARAKSIQVRLKVTGVPFTVRGDSTRVYRSIWNLLENALSHSPENSEVAVELIFDEHFVTFKIRDSGPGIPEEALSSIFDEFYRPDRTHKKSIGSGLGLALVKATVEAHNGEVTARRVEGAGAEFTIMLPATINR